MRPYEPAPVHTGEGKQMDIQLNGETYRLTDAQSLAALLKQLNLTQQALAVALNGTIIPRSKHHEVQLRAGDEVELVQAVGGG